MRETCLHSRVRMIRWVAILSVTALLAVLLPLSARAHGEPPTRWSFAAGWLDHPAAILNYLRPTKALR